MESNMCKYILPFLFLISVPAYAQITVNSSGNIGIGSTPVSSFKIHVEDNNSDGGIRVINTGYSFFNYGVRSVTTGSGDYGYGVYGKAENSMLSHGVYGESFGTTAFNYGVYGNAKNGFMSNYGVRGSASGSSSYGGYFTGGVYVSGGITQSSDERLKTNIRELNNEDITEKVRQLRPMRYEFLKPDELRNQGLPASHTQDGEHFGLIAQELDEIFPELVSDVVHVLNEDMQAERTQGEPTIVTTKAINYQELTVVLLAAVQELQARVELLEIELENK
ncbi:hypothetical protein BH23BAC3_BH23BAC3_34250 [soil metagenome]